MRRSALALVVIATVFSGLARTEDEPKEEVRTGKLATRIFSHPLVETGQDYFDVYEEGKRKGQILIVFPKGVQKPKKRGELMEARGTLRKVKLGGKPGTKGSYQNDVLTVRSWKYLDPEPK